jgi:cyclophilin family peptidyl-prolyl cis-trans isomerase/HEAT repeat protein
MPMRYFVAAVLLAGPMAARLPAQDPSLVEALAPLVMMEDRRAFESATLSRALNDPQPLVRQTAVTTIGRIADRRGIALLVPMLADSDMRVVTATFFSFGLLRDSAMVDVIIARLRSPDPLNADAIGEAATALARIGGPAAARFLGAMLSATTDIPAARQAQFVPAALLDGWHLGPQLIPAQAMLHYASDTSTDLRWRTVYSLGRLRVPAAGQVVLAAIRDPAPSIREIAAKWLTKAFADTAGLAASTVKADLVRALNDQSAGLRINAVASLGTFGDSASASRIIPLLSDGDLNVRVASVSALGAVKGSAAARALDAVMDRRDAPWAMRAAALAALARTDTALFARRAAAWLASGDFRERIVALQAWSPLASPGSAMFRTALGDPDVRVQAAAIGAWRATAGDTALGAVARARMRMPDIGVRAAAISALRTSAKVEDLDLLATAWHQSLSDPGSDARLAIVRVLGALARRQPDLMARLEEPNRRDLLQRPADPVVRADAMRNWPELAARWGEKWPIDTRRTLDDYRAIVRTYMLAADDPHVTVEVERIGSIEIQLLGHEAPLTVANFLRLVDGRKFDGNRWHRVVPNFVVQDGDPTGTGNGGPGWSIRDEINRERYSVPMVGMALSGPDTGGSQWFINVSPQPHLDGQYTIFGKVAGSYAPLLRITQGDVIRSIHR